MPTKKTTIINVSYLSFDEFKCNLKELTTKSAWVPRSAVFGMRMPGGWLHRSCDSLARSVFPSCWVLSPIFFVFLGVFLLYERFVTVVVDFANFFFVFSSVSSKVGSTCLATRWTACRLRLTRPVPRRLRVMNPPRQPPHQFKLFWVVDSIFVRATNLKKPCENFSRETLPLLWGGLAWRFLSLVSSFLAFRRVGHSVNSSFSFSSEVAYVF